MRAVLLTLVLLLPAMASAATDVQGSVPGNTVWKRSGSPYVLRGDVTVPWGAKLTLEPGVQVIAASDDAQGSGVDSQRVELIVDGTLLVRGTTESPVEFTARGAEGAWYGIRVRGGRGTVIDGALLTQAEQGLELLIAATVRNTSVRARAEDCIRVKWGKAVLQGNDVSGCGERARSAPPRNTALTDSLQAPRHNGLVVPMPTPQPLAAPPPARAVPVRVEPRAVEARPVEAPAPPLPPSPRLVVESPSPPPSVAPRPVSPRGAGPPASGECALEPQVLEPPECPGIRRWRKDQARSGAASPGSARPQPPVPRASLGGGGASTARRDLASAHASDGTSPVRDPPLDRRPG
ncbi:hypothetical protein [Archangium primigenium]|uniref:hypothetical protein n=1 Tax=[Archangium] primigenium TaxID=2792470 RepID=UPI001959D42A|nr:hypothetical protein [Archangium primigenium]MBM7115083.1 hypothetical protein [Archangium primigenium]